MLRKLSRKRNAWCLVALLVVVVAAAGCSGEQQQAEQQEAAREARMAELQAEQAQLNAMRAELDELREQVAAMDDEEGEDEAPAEDGEAPDGDEAATTAEDPEARIAELEEQIASRSEEFYSNLVTFINENPPVEGEEPSERQKAAFRMKSEEDIEIAQEYVDEGGDYRRAMSILQDALAIDPDNELLQAALEDVESKRFMSEERFSAVEKGMNRNQVRALLGIPYHANIRTFEDDGVVAWFYPVDPQGSAAAVWFRQQGDGEYEAYKVNFEEVVKGDTDDDAAEDGAA